MLQAGDILANLRSGTFGHAILFDRWTDAEQWNDTAQLSHRDWVRARFQTGVPFVGEEVDRFAAPPRAVVKTYTLQWINGAITVRELNERLEGPYYALRDNRIDGYVATLNGVRLPFKTAVGAQTVAQMVVANRGGTAVIIQKLSVVLWSQCITARRCRSKLFVSGNEYC